MFYISLNLHLSGDYEHIEYLPDALIHSELHYIIRVIGGYFYHNHFTPEPNSGEKYSLKSATSNGGA